MGIDDKTMVIIETDGEKIIIRPLRVVRLRTTPRARLAIEEALHEEYVLEEKKR